MKYLIITLLVCGFLGCQEPIELPLTEPEYNLDVPVFNDVDEIEVWIIENIEYKSDLEVYGKNFWQYPSETFNFKTGDCEDRAILMLYIIHDQFGIDGEFVVYTSSFGYYHSVVRINGKEYLEVFYYDIYVKTVKYENLWEKIRKLR
jgi:hypothetical protein